MHGRVVYLLLPATYSLTSIASYNGTSVINTTGIGYNGEAVPAASTITVNVNVIGSGLIMYLLQMLQQA